MAEAKDLMIVDELERRRANDRERARRSRERKREHGPHPVLDVTPTAAGPRSPSFPVHPTKRLEAIGSGPEAYARIPPPVDAPAVAPPPPTVDQQAGAAKVALLVSGMFGLALSDAGTRYELAGRLAAVGVKPEDYGKVAEAAVAHVHASTMRACLKHGVGISLPYEDELTAIGAAAASGAYLFAKVTGRLDQLERRAAAPGRPEEPRRPAPPVDDSPDSDVIDIIGTLRMDAA